MSVVNLIKQHALTEATAGNFDAVAAILNAATIEQRTSTKIDFDEFIAAIGTETAEQVLAELSMTQIGESLRRRLELSGLDFSDAATIEQLDKVGAKVTSAVLKKLKELGVRFVSLAGETVTADQCRDAWSKSTLTAHADALYQSFLNRLATAKTGINDGTLTTTAQVTAAIGGA